MEVVERCRHIIKHYETADGLSGKMKKKQFVVEFIYSIEIIVLRPAVFLHQRGFVFAMHGIVKNLQVLA
jgi:hypothetical protein